MGIIGGEPFSGLSKDVQLGSGQGSGSTLTSRLVAAAEHHPHSIMLPTPSRVLPPDMTLIIKAKQFNLSFIRPENLVSHGLRVL